MSERYQFLLLHDAGSIPGIPGSHGRGSYVIDWQERTLHEAVSLDDYLLSLESAQPDEESTEPDASVSAPDGQETGREESAAITAPEPEMPQEEAVSDGGNAPDNVASPIAVGGNEQVTESDASAGAQA